MGQSFMQHTRFENQVIFFTQAWWPVTDRASVAVKNVGLARKAQRQSEGSNIRFYYPSKYSGELLSLSIGRGQKAAVSRNITCSASKWGRGQYAAVPSSIKNTC